MIPADGWLIDGNNIEVSEQNTTSYIETRKSTFRDCLLEMKAKVESRYEPESIISECSPALLGGSLVQNGYGRMIVLCVGKLSRKGSLL